VNYEAWNRYVLMAIGLFGALLYIGLVYAGFVEFMSRIAKRARTRKVPGIGSRIVDSATRRFRDTKP
jgi:O-antigen ligase